VVCVCVCVCVVCRVSCARDACAVCAVRSECHKSGLKAAGTYLAWKAEGDVVERPVGSPLSEAARLGDGPALGLRNARVGSDHRRGGRNDRHQCSGARGEHGHRSRDTWARQREGGRRHPRLLIDLCVCVVCAPAV
jgi:hypothetical protein